MTDGVSGRALRRPQRTPTPLPAGNEHAGIISRKGGYGRNAISTAAEYIGRDGGRAIATAGAMAASAGVGLDVSDPVSLLPPDARRRAEEGKANLVPLRPPEMHLPLDGISRLISPHMPRRYADAHRAGPRPEERTARCSESRALSDTMSAITVTTMHIDGHSARSLAVVRLDFQPLHAGACPAPNSYRGSGRSALARCGCDHE